MNRDVFGSPGGFWFLAGAFGREATIGGFAAGLGMDRHQTGGLPTNTTGMSAFFIGRELT